MTKADVLKYNVELPAIKGFITYLMRADGRPVVHFKIGTQPDHFIFAEAAKVFGEQLIEAASHASDLAAAFKAMQQVVADMDKEDKAP